jgi:hypothetical protein
MANRRFIDFPIAASVGNNDIVLIWQDGLNKQTTKATLLQGSPQSLAGLTDVDIAALTNGQILQYNSTTSKWENVDRTDIFLSQLGDVTIVAPSNGQVLVYNSSTSKWENSSGGYVPYTGAVTTVNLGSQTIQAGSFVKAGGTAAQFLKANGSVDSTAYGTGTVTSVALTMPTAFTVAGSPITTTGTLAVTATGTTAQYIRGDGSLATFPGLTGFVPYTGATADVNLGTFDLLAERGTFENNGSSDALTVNQTSGSGYGIIVTKGGNNEALYVNKTSGSGNAMTVVGGRTSLVDLALSSVTNTAGDFLTLSGGVVHKRTAAQTLTDIGGQAALTNPVTGTGTTNYLSKFTGASTIGNSNLQDDGTNILSSLAFKSTANSNTFGNASLSGRAVIIQSGSTNQAIMFKNAAGGDGTLFIKGTSTTVDYNFNTYSVGDALVIKNSGRIGIGTESPERLFEISEANRPQMRVQYKGISDLYLDISDERLARRIISDTGGNNFTMSVEGGQGSGGFGAFTIETGTIGNLSEKFRVQQNGNIGIGTTSASQALSIGNGTSTKYIRIQGTVADSYFGSDTVGTFFGNTSNAHLYINTNGLERMRISSGGDIGIGADSNSIVRLLARGKDAGATNYAFIAQNSSTTNLFLIRNDGAASFFSLGTGTVTATGGTLSTVSDSSYKIDDGYIDSALEKVLNLKPRYFYWNEKSGLPKDIRQLGFYAQEVNEALGEEAANKPKNKNTPYGISDRSMIAMLTKAIQELKQEIDTLKN